MKDNNNKFSEFDDQTKEESIIEIPKEVRKIKTQAYDKSVSDIVRMINEKDINLNPEYQRNYIWNNKKASLLIESIILNVPIPVIYVSQEEDDSWTVIDGLQRLTSLKRFFDRDFKLTGLEILTDLTKSDVKSLNPKALRVLKNGLLRVIVISHDSHPEIKYDVFMRLNNGAVKLNDQELRNCLYRGQLNTLLKDCANDENFLKLMKLKEPHNRMSDCELILRFFAIYSNYEMESHNLNDYKGRMKTYLNDFMRYNEKIEELKLNEYRELLISTSRKVYNVFGENAFRRYNIEGKYENALNRSLLDILMLSFAHTNEEKLDANKDDIVGKLNELMVADTEFIRSITIGTSDTPVVNYRLERWIKELSKLVG